MRLPKTRKEAKEVSALIGSLEHVLFVAFSSLYLQDCSVFALLLRTATQLPQSPALVAKSLRRTIFYIIGINVIFVVNHWTRSTSNPPLIIDFFGRARVSRHFLIASDLFIAILQLLRVLIMQSSTTTNPYTSNIPSKHLKHARSRDSLTSNTVRSLSREIQPLTKQWSTDSFNYGTSTANSATSNLFESEPFCFDSLFRGPFESVPVTVPPFPIYPFTNHTASASQRRGSNAAEIRPLTPGQFEVDADDVFRGVPIVDVYIPWPNLLSAMPMSLRRRTRRMRMDSLDHSGSNSAGISKATSLSPSPPPSWRKNRALSPDAM
ncbi:hypothetical protein HDU79_010685 [Rhizoclosmatium sp. JEL0117]|nr:hypothetical protein HDU79_010685 [Rhizoclosmatium sp. JEL0117]